MIFRWELKLVWVLRDGFQTQSGILCDGLVGDLWPLNSSGAVAYQPSPLTEVKLAQDVEGSV